MLYVKSTRISLAQIGLSCGQFVSNYAELDSDELQVVSNGFWIGSGVLQVGSSGLYVSLAGLNRDVIRVKYTQVDSNWVLLCPNGH